MKKLESKIVREVYHRGTIVGNASTPLPVPFRFPFSKMTHGIPGRVEVAEFSPHFAYAYTTE